MFIQSDKATRIRQSATAGWLAVRASYASLNHTTRKIISWLLMLLLVAYFVFCGVFLSLRYLVLPNIDYYKPKVEQLASHFVERPVSINTIEANWHGLYPTLQLRQVIIHNNEGNAALILPEVDATLSWFSLLTGQLHLHTLEINRPDLEIERKPDGKIFVAGIPVDTDKAHDNGHGLDWLLSQRQIVVRGGLMRWRDMQRDAPELLLTDVNLQLKNGWRSHHVALKAIPPEELAAPIDLRAEFTHPAFGKISDYSQWAGEIYVDWRKTSLEAWKKYFDYPYDIKGGNGSVRAWLNFDRGVVKNFTADLALADISARLGDNLAPLNLVEVSGRISAGEMATDLKQKIFSYGLHGHVLKLTNFSLRTDFGTVLPTTTVSSTFTAPGRGHPERREIEVTEIDLDTLAQLARHLPLAPEERRMLTEFSPHGRLQNFLINWEGAEFGAGKYQVKGKFSDLALKSQQSQQSQQSRPVSDKHAAFVLPSFDGFSGEVDANQESGKIKLNGEKSNFSMPGLFADSSLAFEKLALEASWSRDAHERFHIQVSNMQFSQEGVQGTLEGKYEIPLHGGSEKLGNLDLKVKVPAIELTQVARFMPKMSPEALRHWMAEGLLGGQAKNVEVIIQGDLDKFPFESKKDQKPAGVFKITGEVENGKLIPGYEQPSQYKRNPSWPRIDEIRGNLTLDRTHLVMHASSARTNDLLLSAVDVSIPDYWAENSTLEVSGTVNGSMQSMLGYVNSTPVSGWIDGFADEIKANGNARLNLKMQLPLGDTDEKMVKGSLRFMGNDIQLMRNFPMIQQTHGELAFTDNGFQLSGVQGNLLGGQMQVSGGTQRDGSSQFKIDGAINADGLARAYPGQALQKLAKKLTGSMRYNGTLRIKNQRPELFLESSMAGLGIDLPSPLNKPVSDPLPLRVIMSPVSSSDQLMQTEELRFNLGRNITARYLLQKPNARAASWKMVRGGIGVNVPAPQPENGLAVSLNMSQFNLDAWRITAAALMDDARPDAVGKSSGMDATAFVTPDVFNVRATELIIAEKALSNAVLGASHLRATWLINLHSDQIAGHINWTDPSSERGAGKLTAHLVKLIIPKSSSSEVTDILSGKRNTAQLPGLDLIADNVELMDIKLGRLEVNATNAGFSQGREWRINRLVVTNPDGVLRASGKWSVSGRDNQSIFNYELDIADAGRLLDRFGFERTVKGGKGSMEGELSWKGPPYSFDFPTLSGNLSLKVSTGQFLKVEPGVAKLLGVMSLQALPRRLTLDFRDVFSDGFVFDVISGTGTITRGVIKTDTFKMRGTSSVVLMDGSVDLKDETQNLNVVVVPELNTAGASVVYGLAVNPIIGLGGFLAQLFLKNPISQALSQEYLITGPWKDPVIKKVTTKRKINTGPADAGQRE